MTEFATARLVEMEPGFKKPKAGGRSATVQFNPETLKVSYSNQLSGQDKDSAGKSADGSAGKQLVGQGSTKLSLQLWFDVSAPMPKGQAPVDDVRRLTQAVIQLMSPAASAEPDKFIAPAVGFIWGSFSFAGVIDALEETLEFFSPDGVPLRAGMSLSMSRQNILVPVPAGASPARGAGPAVGTRPLAQAPGGSNVASLVARAGQGADWQGIAAANGIENPRRLAAGQLLDLAARPLRGDRP